MLRVEPTSPERAVGLAVACSGVSRRLQDVTLTEYEPLTSLWW